MMALLPGNTGDGGQSGNINLVVGVVFELESTAKEHAW